MTLTLKVRLAIVVGAGTLAVASSAACAVWYADRNAAAAHTDTMLRAPARRLTERTGWDTDWAQFDRSLLLVFGESWATDGICRVVGNRPGSPVYYESDNWPEDLMVRHPPDTTVPPPPAGGGDAMADFEVRTPYLYDAGTYPGQHWRLVNLANSDLTMHLGVRTDARRDRQSTLALQLAAAVVGLSALMASLSYLVAGQALRPVRRIAATASSISASELSRRIDPPPGCDPEFARLIDVFNDMIDRLERSFLQSSRFSADASHELKTPVTNLAGEIAARLNECQPGSEEQRFLAGLLEEVERIRSILSGLLLLAKSDAGKLPLTRTQIDLASFARGIAEDLGSEAAAAGLHFTFTDNTAGNPRPFLADPVMLSQAFHNLGRNAIDHNTDAGSIDVALATGPDGDALEFRISNTAHPPPEGWADHLFTRFYKNRSTGAGLGLNIAYEILTAHGATLELADSPPTHITFVARFAEAAP